MRYILHYTDPGDIVFDGFCGSGMTGVAAQLCGDKRAVESLGYYVDADGWIYEKPPAGPPHPPTPSPTREEGEAAAERWDVPEALRQRMVEVAREFRKTPTRSEDILWQALRNRQLEGVKVRRQQPIGPFVVDFFVPAHRLVIEVDGPIHADQQQLDRERQSLLESLGLHFLRLPAELVEADLPAALDRIRTTLRASRPSPLVGEGSGVRGPIPISRLGPRKAVLVDLSPAATFIAYNYNAPVDTAAFEHEAKRILAEVEQECGWMYETWHPHCDHPQRVKGRINYTVWSEVFACPHCTGEITFLDEALDEETLRVRDEFPCPHCGALVSKRSMDRIRVTSFDQLLNQPTESLKRRPISIEYTVGRAKHTKPVDEKDLQLLERVHQMPPAEGIPVAALPISRMAHGSRLAPKGVAHVHQLFLPRPSHALALLWQKARAVADARLRAFLLFTVEQAIWGMSLLNRYGPTHFSQVNRYLSGVYYISSLISEVSPWYILEGKSQRIAHAFAGLRVRSGDVIIATQSAAVSPAVEGCVDYIFTDPPFGSNIIYSDLSIIWEAWLRLSTQTQNEAVVHRRKKSDAVTMDRYRQMMTQAFCEMHRVLKPGRWMTVEFHNTQNAVYNAVQEAIVRAGFVLADVRVLDKQLGTFKQVSTGFATKQDLVISAYKPTITFERRFETQAGTEAGAWAFVEEHLRHLPMPQLRGDRLEVLAERQAYLLYDRMVAFHIQRGLTVPLGAADFYAGLRQRYSERDGMYFLPLQAQEYDRLRLEAHDVEQLPLIVSDEKSAILWLRRHLGEQPQTYQDLQPRFLRELHQAGHEKLPELRDILEENFLQDEAGRWYVPDPARAGDLEKLRERSLLREFREYVEGRGRLRVFRGEAVRAGFRDAWRRRDYAVIVAVARRLPERVLQEDADLLMYYDNALLRMGND
jgi:very-short-patch-repair endonuclease